MQVSKASNDMTVSIVAAEYERLRARADDWQAMKDERDAAIANHNYLLDETRDELNVLNDKIAKLMADNKRFAEAVERTAVVIERVYGNLDLAKMIRAYATGGADVDR